MIYWTSRLVLRLGRVPAKVSESPHLIFFIWNFPPTITGGVYRPLAIVKYLVRLGWRVTIVTHDAPSVPSEREAGDYLVRQLPKKVSIYKIGLQFPIRLKVGKLLSAAMSPGLEMADQVRHLPITFDQNSVIFASGPPFFTFLSAAIIAKANGRPLVVDYRDEWCDNPYSWSPRGLWDRQIESWIQRLANRIYYTTESQIEFAAKNFGPHIRGSARFFPNGWDPDDFEATQPRLIERSNPVRIGYFGTLGDHCDPLPFLCKLRDELRSARNAGQDIQFLIVGVTVPDIERQIKTTDGLEFVEMRDLVPKNEAVALMETCSALMVFATGAFKRYIPGKLYDYLASGRPIIVYGEDSESARIVRDCQSGVVIEERSQEPVLPTLCQLALTPNREGSHCVHGFLRARKREHLIGELDRDLRSILEIPHP